MPRGPRNRQESFHYPPSLHPQASRSVNDDDGDYDDDDIINIIITTTTTTTTTTTNNNNNNNNNNNTYNYNNDNNNGGDDKSFESSFSDPKVEINLLVCMVCNTFLYTVQSSGTFNQSHHSMEIASSRDMCLDMCLATDLH